jgi:hypothetical protein
MNVDSKPGDDESLDSKGSSEMVLDYLEMTSTTIGPFLTETTVTPGSPACFSFFFCC